LGKGKAEGRRRGGQGIQDTRGSKGWEGRGEVGEEGVEQTTSHVLKHLTFLVMKSSGW